LGKAWILLKVALYLFQQNGDNPLGSLNKKQIVMSQIEFYDRFDKMTALLQSFAYSLTKNSEDARDLYQETAFRALTNRDKFRVGTNFKAWLFTIMKNIFINNYRKKMKANTIMDSTDNMYYINSGSVTIDNGAESNIMMKELTKMIGHLDESIRIPFLMHYQGYKYQEIADHLDLPLGTVKSRIFFARKDLKAQIKKSYGNLNFFKNSLQVQ
jgi:RNA polymerase sigma-70 factor (ECF subfamily)